ncbi:MAG: hypothetical protein AAF638_07850 [Pseudomonadota bacterium]
MGKFLHGVVTLLLALFFLVMMLFRFTEGSFEAAGTRMDAIMGFAAEEGGEALEDLADDADTVIRDLQDGPDDQN